MLRASLLYVFSITIPVCPDGVHTGDNGGIRAFLDLLVGGRGGVDWEVNRSTRRPIASHTDRQTAKPTARQADRQADRQAAQEDEATGPPPLKHKNTQTHADSSTVSFDLSSHSTYLP